MLGNELRIEAADEVTKEDDQGVKTVKEAAKKVLFFRGPTTKEKKLFYHFFLFVAVEKKVPNGHKAEGGKGLSGRPTKKITFFVASLKKDELIDYFFTYSVIYKYICINRVNVCKWFSLP